MIGRYWNIDMDLEASSQILTILKDVTNAKTL